MTYNQSTPLSISEQRRLEAVEMDVRRAMKEACKPYAGEIKEAIQRHHRGSRAILADQLGKLIFSLSVLCYLSGCGLLGVREMDAWGFKMQFAEGLDLHAGANSVDRVEDKRGVSPIASYSQPVLPNPKGRY